MSSHEHSRTKRRPGWSTTAGALLENLSRTGRGRKQGVSVVADVLTVLACLWLAYTLRLGHPFSDFRSTWHVFALVASGTVLVFTGFGIYRWVVRSSNQRLVGQIAKAAVVSALLVVMVVYLLPPDRRNPRSLFAIYGLLLFAGTMGTRLAWQALVASGSRGEPVAVYGAGATGRRVVRLLQSSSDYRPVVLVDDDPGLAGTTVEGVPVIDGLAGDLRARLARHDVLQVVIAIDTLTHRQLEDKLAFLRALDVQVKIMPSIAELVSGDARPDEIRDISIADILGRSEVVPDIALMGGRVAGRAVLVTGGAGSIGSELARQIQGLGPSRLVVLDNSEAALYEITEELGPAFGTVPGAPSAPAFVPVLGSVKDRRDVDDVLARYGVDIVFHAAAYKHVPIVENQPEQGVETNVFGTLNVVRAAIDAGVADVVLISTDKAVRPANAMGASKRVAEMILQALTREQSATRLSMVRFGNVLGSSGSVVPKFKRQILSGGPVTLTDPDITRYFMTIPEAAQLVLQAAAIARGGDVFVLDMGDPVRIADLARSMVRLYGRALREDTGNPDDVEIVVEGLRPGEKMYEELFLSDEHRDTSVPKISTAEEAWLPWDALERRLDALREMTERRDADGVRRALLELAGAGTRRGRPDEAHGGAPDGERHGEHRGEPAAEHARAVDARARSAAVALP